MSLTALDRSYLGPILRTRTGQNVRIRFTNDIDDLSISPDTQWRG